MGKQYLLNLYGCSFVLLDDERCLIDLLENAAIASGATVCQTISKKFEPQGVTVLCLLSESHISIHSFEEREYCFVDIFSRTIFNKEEAIDTILNTFEPKSHNINFLNRFC